MQLGQWACGSLDFKVHCIRLRQGAFNNVSCFLPNLRKGYKNVGRKGKTVWTITGTVSLRKTILVYCNDAIAASRFLLLSLFLSNSISIPIFDCVTRE